jgi:hypothetical protein
MKKISLLLFVFCSLAMGVFAQLPYSKMMNLSRDELEAKGFKFNQKKNQYVLAKTNGLNVTVGVLSAMAGSAATYAPSPKDYNITVQFGEYGVSSLTAIFYSDDTYNDIQTWLAENNIQTITSASGKISFQKFSYDSLQVELRSQAVIQSDGTELRSRSSSSSNTKDNSYTIYTYTIDTGKPPYSEWHLKEQKKREERLAKGKKEDLKDLF